MKRVKIFILCLAIAVPNVALGIVGDLELDLCMTSKNCVANIGDDCGKKFCCPTGKTTTTYTCPLGWSRDITTNICSRIATTGNDSIGYYTQNYGTCEPITNEEPCFEFSFSPSGANGMNCMTCITGV